VTRSSLQPARPRTHSRRSIPLLAAGLIGLLALATLYTLGTRSTAPLLGDRDSPILLAWTSNEVDPAFAGRASRLPGVSAVAAVGNGVGWLSSWGADDGETRSAPAGYRVPVEIAAVDPGDYATFVPPEQREVFQQLSQGGALLGRTGAELRGIESTGTLQFEKVTVPVKGVVDDELVASHEVIVSNQTAAALGIEDVKYVLIALDRGTSPEEVEQQLRRGLPEGKRLGTRTPAGEARAFRPGGAILPQGEVKKVFGEFAARPGRGAALAIDPAWIEANTANVNIPLLGLTRCHKSIVPAVRGAFNEIIAEGLSSLVRRGDFGGCFAPRLLNSDPHSGISRHAWGAAFDFNVSRNAFGQKPSMDPRLIEILERWGFGWGGTWMVPDGMHFEYLQPPKR
jgi:hypothetical protein